MIAAPVTVLAAGLFECGGGESPFIGFIGFKVLGRVLDAKKA